MMAENDPVTAGPVAVPMEQPKPVENKPSPEQPAVQAQPAKMTRAEFVAELEQLIARGDAAGLESLHIITSLYAKQSTKKITSVLDAFLDGLAGPSR